jgi:hypothetical protein
MEVWIGGEICPEIDDQFSAASEAVEEVVNAVIGETNYTIPLDDWDCIAIIRDDDDFRESTKFYRSQQRADVRLIVDHAAFSSASASNQARLIFKMVLRSLVFIETQLPECTDLQLLETDLLKAGREAGWKVTMTSAAA